MSPMATTKGTSPSPAEREVLNGFRRLVRALRLSDRATLQDYGLGSAQIYVLHQLALESRLSVNDLAERTGTDQSTVSVVVNKLVARKLIERRVAKQDGRRAELSLTTSGRALARRLPAPFQESFLAAVATLPPRRVSDLAGALQRILEAMGEDTDAPAPMLLSDGPRSARRAAPQKRKS
jgi:DNA-binding MarR family transcriptional regulator